MESAGDLTVLLINSFTSISKNSSALAQACQDEAKTLLTNFMLKPDVHRVLDTFIMAMKFFTDDVTTFGTELHVVSSLQPKGDILEPGSDQDMISCGLLLFHLVSFSTN